MCEMKTYRYKPTVEAMRWTDTAANRETFSTWFEKHDTMFVTRGPQVVLPEYGTACKGDWILCVDGAFIAMKDKLFTADYEEIP